MNSRSVASEIVSNADIVQIVSDYVALKRAGKNYKGLCPFHTEKTPSFTVSPDKQMYHCFGCGAGGNVITFVSKIENMPPRDAVRALADRLGIRLRARDENESDVSFSQRKLMLDAYRFAAQFYHEFLMNAPQAEAARKTFFEKRKLSEESVKAFQLGVSPAQGQELVKRCAARKIPLPLLEACGLAHNSGGVVVDRFRGRLMFPITDIQGNVCGFSGRALAKGEEPKYINTPETPVFNKGRLLYAFHLARKSMAQFESALLMEGYMDVIMAHQHGFTQSVASMGTALTPYQAKLLAQQSKKVIVCYDSDTAGQEATWRSILLLLEAAASVYVLELPKGHDPDTFLLEQGKDAFHSALVRAKTFVDFQCDQLLLRYRMSDPSQKREILLKILPSLEKIREPLLQYEFVQRVAARLSVDPQLLKKMAGGRQRGKLSEMVYPAHSAQKHLEEMLLSGMLMNENVFQHAKLEIAPEDFTLPFYQEIARVLFLEGMPENAASFLELLEDESARGALSAVVLSQDSEANEKMLHGCVLKLKEERINKEIHVLQKEAKEFEQQGQFDEAKKIVKEVLEKEKQRRKLKNSA